ncbi:helix-turn-helix transcriptional regulator [Actinacidiphila glaucinigra]|nr:LuxR family transcriptional regulator [Actinacidiphila glaucinigra]
MRQALVTAAPEGNTFTFRHPLIRTVVLHAMEPGRRQRALVRLADVSTISRAVWYREAGAVSQDEELAQLLAETAEDASRRGAYHSAACAWQAAAQRGEAEATRTTRLTRGAEAALLSGDPAWASRLARDALDLPGDTGTKTAAQLALGRAYTWIGRPELAFSVLTRSATLVRRELPDVAETMMREAILPMVMSGNAEKGLEALESWLTSGYDGRVDATASLLGPVLALRGHVIEGARALEQYQDVVEASDPLRDGLSLCLVSQGYIWLDRPLKGRRLLQSVIAAARTAGSLSVLPYALALHSELDIWEGRWAVASADALEALRWAREFGMPGIAAFALSALARLDALRGSRAACAQRIEQARQLAGEAGMWALEAHFAAALGLDCLASGELASAIDHLSQASAHEKRAGIGNPMIAPHLPDLAEAHVRAGSVDAPYLLERLEAAAESTRLAWMQAAHARCRMLAAQSAKEVDQWWFLAHAAHSRRGLPYEEARTLLCRGEALRRQRVAVRAREPLLEALSKFVSLGAQPWAARTRAELRAAGYRGPDLPEGQASEALGLLTGQELQVARAVARGLSNAEVAACLFISQKTVEAHLTRVYRKLRTRSRAELAGRLRTLIE